MALMKPRILDLGCKAGGASMGLKQAGFEVSGLDIQPQPHYPFTFILGDMLTYPLDGYDCYWASPPCELWSACVNPTGGKEWRLKHADLITPMRERLIQTGKPFVIENVPGSPLQNYIKIDGTMVGIRTIKERWFECHGFEVGFLPTKWNANGLVKRGIFAGIMRHGKNSEELTRREHLAAAYEINWFMDRDELRKAIPPAMARLVSSPMLKEIIGACL
jgi:DNA (cytosine-5)-methyltransferase 1